MAISLVNLPRAMGIFCAGLVFLIACSPEVELDDKAVSCVKQSDLACIARLVPKLPDHQIEHLTKVQGAETLALLGSVEEAFELRAKQSKTFDRARISAAAMAYEIQGGDEKGFQSIWDAISDPEERLSALGLLPSIFANADIQVQSNVTDLYIEELRKAAPRIVSEERWKTIIDQYWMTHTVQLEMAIANVEDQSLRQSLLRYLKEQRPTGMWEIADHVVEISRIEDIESVRELIESAFEANGVKADEADWNKHLHKLAREITRSAIERKQDLESARKLEQAIVQIVNRQGDQICISAIHSALSVLFAHLNKQSYAFELLDKAEQFAAIDSMSREFLHDCLVGYPETLYAVRAALGDKSKLQATERELLARAVDDPFQGRMLGLVIFFGLQDTGDFATSEDRAYVLNTAMSLDFASRSDPLPTYKKAIGYALRAGDINQAFDIAQMMLNTINDPRNKHNQTPVAQSVIEAFIGNGFSIGWLLHQGTASR